MDSQFTGPFGIKFGLDGLLGFIPVVGDVSTTLVSVFILSSAAQGGCSPAVLVRMALNIIFDSFLDSVPIIGNFADFFWRSNERNIALMENYQLTPQKTQRQSLGLLIGLLAFVFAGLALSVYLTVKILGIAVVYLQSLQWN